MNRISEYDEYRDRDEVVKFIEARGYDLSILEWDTTVVVKNDDGFVVGVGNYQISPFRVEIVTDSEQVAIEICKYFGGNRIREADCSNQVINKVLNHLIEHPFAPR